MTITDKVILSIELRETQRTRHYWLAKEYEHSAVKSKASGDIDILFAPWEKFRDERDLFPQDTGELFKFIQKKRPDISATIAMPPEDYREVTLHGNEFRLPTILVKEALVAIVVGLCAEFLIHRLAHPVKDTAEIEMIVETTSHKCISVKYKGPVGKLAERVVEEVERCLPRGSSAGDTPGTGVPKVRSKKNKPLSSQD